MKLGTNENNHRTMVNRWDEVLRGIRDLKDTWKLSTQEYQGLDEQAENNGQPKHQKINVLQRDDEVSMKTGPINVSLPEKIIQELPGTIVRKQSARKGVA